MIRENGVDVYRQDFNLNPLDYWRLNDAPGRKGYTENRYITNLYRLLDALRSEFPDLLIDNCASGGRRLDFEMNSRSVPMWRSDTGCYEPSDDKPIHLWNQNQVLGLTRYLPYHATSTWTTDAYTFRSAETMGLACELDVMSGDFDIAVAARPLKEMTGLRELWDGDFYPLTEASVSDGIWAAYQLHCGTKGFCAFFRRKKASMSQAFELNALDPDAAYEITLTDDAFRTQVRTITGSELRSFTAEIGSPEGSLILRYEKNIK
jgi:alpha-galactosidase